MEDEDLLELFEEASGGKATVTFDEAIRLEGVDGVLDEGAVTLQELQFLWGDDSKALDFKAWSKWYAEVLKLYDEFLWKDAVAPPTDLLADVQEELEEEVDFTDEELLEDAPTQDTNISTLIKQREAQQAAGQRQLPPVQAALAAPPPTSESGRENLEITRMFREGCDEQNLLSFEALVEIDEISGMMKEGEITKDELKDMWAGLPSKDGLIDILAFKDLMGKVDDLFEYEEEEVEELDLAATAKAPLGDLKDTEAPVVPTSRSPAVVKSELQTVVQGLEEEETRPCGLDGREETDGGVTKLTSELEKLWREKMVDVADFDETELIGDWELVYSTSAKFRRWQAVLNAEKYIKGGVVDGLVQNFTVDRSTQAREYDMEEFFVREGEEFAMRAFGAWSVGLQSNVVTGDDDLVLKINLNSVEYDTKDGDVEPAEKKLLESQMVRTYCYSFIAYVDEELRIMRTGLSNNSVFIYQRIKDD